MDASTTSRDETAIDEFLSRDVSIDRRNGIFNFKKDIGFSISLQDIHATHRVQTVGVRVWVSAYSRVATTVLVDGVQAPTPKSFTKTGERKLTWHLDSLAIYDTSMKSPKYSSAHDNMVDHGFHDYNTSPSVSRISDLRIQHPKAGIIEYHHITSYAVAILGKFGNNVLNKPLHSFTYIVNKQVVYNGKPTGPIIRLLIRTVRSQCYLASRSGTILRP